MTVDERTAVHDGGDCHIGVEQKQAGDDLDRDRDEVGQRDGVGHVESRVVDGLEDEVPDDGVESVGRVIGRFRGTGQTGGHGLLLQVLPERFLEAVRRLGPGQDIVAEEDRADGSGIVFIFVDEVVPAADEGRTHEMSHFRSELGKGLFALCIFRDDAVGKVQLVHLEIVSGVVALHLMAGLGVEQFFEGFELRGVVLGGVFGGVVPDPAVAPESELAHREQRHGVVEVDEAPDVVVALALEVLGGVRALRRLVEHGIEIFLPHLDAGALQRAVVDGCSNEVADGTAAAVAGHPDLDVAFDLIVFDELLEELQGLGLVAGEVVMLAVAPEVEVAGPFSLIAGAPEAHGDDRIVFDLFAGCGDADAVRGRFGSEPFIGGEVFVPELLQKISEVLASLGVRSLIIGLHGSQRQSITGRHEADVRCRRSGVQRKVVVGVIHDRLVVLLVARVVHERIPLRVPEGLCRIGAGGRRFDAARQKAEHHRHRDQNSQCFFDLFHHQNPPFIRTSFDYPFIVPRPPSKINMRCILFYAGKNHTLRL